MAADYTWPLTLPQHPLNDSYQEGVGSVVYRTAMDRGPAKMRYGGKRSQQFSTTWMMTSAQVEILREFVFDTRRSVSRFYLPHPRTGETIEANIVPAENGDQYTLTPIGPGFWQVAMMMEELP